MPSIRKVKRRITLLRRADKVCWGPWGYGGRVEWAMDGDSAPRGFTDAQINSMLGLDEVEAAKVEYAVARKKDGVVVDTFDFEEDALELIEKHKRQKKAALYIV